MSPYPVLSSAVHSLERVNLRDTMITDNQAELILSQVSTTVNIEKSPGGQKMVKILPGMQMVVAAVKSAGIGDIRSKVTSPESCLLQLDVDWWCM